MVHSVPLVVVAEADRLAADLLSGYLSANGLRVEPAHDGVQAYLKTVRLHPDLLLTDLRLPRIDGFELVRRLKSDERARDVPVVAIHDGSIEELAARAELPDTVRVLAGPVELQELLQQLHGVLRQTRALRREAAFLRSRSRIVRAQVANLILLAHGLIDKSRLLLERPHQVE